MEVHHHAHTARKKWTHYFWEFIMLFLAVFCGFLAEYQLEHKIEREKGKQYIHSYYEDLIKDTSILSRVINAYEIKIAALQDREACFDTLTKDIKSENCFWSLLFNTTYFPDLVYTDRTIQQLKNAGGLRLLKPVDADSILVYDNMLREFSKGETAQQEIQETIRNTMYSLVSHERFDENQAVQPVSFLYGNNRELLNRYFNQLMGYTAIMQDGLTDLKNIRNRAFILITYFKKKYNLK